MPLSIHWLDKAAIEGRRIGAADYNLRCQKIFRPQDRLARDSFGSYRIWHRALSIEEQHEENLAVFLASPLKDYLNHLCTLSTSERLEEIRHPQSLIRWAYGVILELMLELTDKVSMIHMAYLLEAAEAGLDGYSISHPHPYPANTDIQPWETEFITYFARRMMRKIARQWPEIRLVKAVFYSIPKEDISPDDRCDICYDPLREESPEKPENFALPWHSISRTNICYPDFLEFVFKPVAAAPYKPLTPRNWQQRAESVHKTCQSLITEFFPPRNQPLTAAYTLLNKWQRRMQLDLVDADRSFEQLRVIDYRTESVIDGFQKIYNSLKHQQQGYTEAWNNGLQLVKKLYPKNPFTVWNDNIIRTGMALFEEQLSLGHAVKLDCGHIYHRCCIYKWLSSMNSGTCPYCRADIVKYPKAKGYTSDDNDSDDEEDDYDDSDDDDGDEDDSDGEYEAENGNGLDSNQEVEQQDDVSKVLTPEVLKPEGLSPEGLTAEQEDIRRLALKLLDGQLFKDVDWLSDGTDEVMEGEENDEKNRNGGEQEGGGGGGEEVDSMNDPASLGRILGQFSAIQENSEDV